MTTEIKRDVIYSEDMDLSYQKDNSEFTSLMNAVIRLCSTECIDSLISDGANVNSRNSYDDDKTALHYAVAHRNCDYDIILTLLRNGADVQAYSRSYHRTPIHFAVQNPFMKPEIIRALLSCQGADVNVLGGLDCMFTPLHCALGGPHCKFETVQVLLESKANLRQDVRGLLPIHVALLNSNCSLRIIQFLVQAGSPVSSDCLAGPPLFILLCRPDCDSESVKLLLEKGANPNCKVDRFLCMDISRTLQTLFCSSEVSLRIQGLPKCSIFCGWFSPLFVGLTLPNISPNIVELLLKYIDNPKYALNNGYVLNTALCSFKLSIPKLRILLKYGAELRSIFLTFENPLYDLLYAQPCDLTSEMLKILLENMDSRELVINGSDCTFLHRVIDKNVSANYLLVLKKYDIPLDQVGPCRSSSLHHAVKSSCPLWVIESFLQESACVDVRDSMQNTPLHLAGSRPEVVATLLRFGADPTLFNKHSFIPLHVFFESHKWSFQMLQILVKTMVLKEYLAEGYFDAKIFVDSILNVKKIIRDVIQLKNDLIPFVQDCLSELAYACSDPRIFYSLMSRFSLKLQLKKGLIEQKSQTSEEKLSIKEKMLQTLHDENLFWVLTSNGFPIYKDFLLMLLSKLELSCIASELKIPLKTIGSSLELKYATPEIILLVAEYLTLDDLSNLILAFIKSSSL